MGRLNPTNFTMRTFFALAALSLVISTIAMPERPSGIVQRYSTNGITLSFTEMALPEAGKVQLCGTCASLTGQSLNILLNYILNAGVVGGCSKVCGQLKQKTERTVCSIACDLVGIKAFAKALEKADLDPIYFCEELGVCKADDNGAGSISSLTVSPKSGAQATKFEGAL